MRYKGIILDIDDTIYNYKIAHENGLKAVFNYMNKNHNISREKAYNSYMFSRKIINERLSGTASSHSRTIYFKTMLEKFDIPVYTNTVILKELYWKYFFNSMIIYDGVYDLIQLYTNSLCFLTDLTTEVQLKKISFLELDKYNIPIITSEEVGAEKPNKIMFDYALKSLNLKKNEVVMIGDNYNKDILGAINYGIDAIWLSKDSKEKVNNQLTILNSFKKIQTYLK